jgi:hypothetical protein
MPFDYGDLREFIARVGELGDQLSRCQLIKPSAR